MRQQRAHARIVRCDHERRAAGETLRAQQFERRGGVRVVQIRGRLVGEHQRRPVDDARALRRHAAPALATARADSRRARSATPTDSSRIRTRAGSSGWPARYCARRRLSATSSAPTRWSRCGTRPTLRPRQRSRAAPESPPRSVPPTIAVPVVGVVSAARMCRSVVLPLPDAPASSQCSPAPARHCVDAEHGGVAVSMRDSGEREHPAASRRFPATCRSRARWPRQCRPAAACRLPR